MSEIKLHARKMKAAVQRHGVITVFVDDEGKAHALPGYSPVQVGTYDKRISQADLMEDLEHTERGS